MQFELRLMIKHPLTDPALMTETLGLTPQVLWVAGEPRSTPAGTPLPGTNRESMWTWSTCIENRRLFFEDVAALVTQLEPHGPFLREIVDSGGSVLLAIHLPGDVNIGSSIPWQELQRLVNLKIELGVEVFPKFNRTETYPSPRYN